MQARVVRDWSLAGEGKYWNAYLGDTISFDRLTLNAGVRWDRAASSVGAGVGARQPGLAVAAAGADAPAVEDAIVYSNVTPRVGFTYALNRIRKTIVRGSYAIFASQLDSNRSPLTVSAIPYYSYVYYAAVDTNGNRIADLSEFTTFQGVAGFDPDNPLGGNPDRIGDYSSPLTHELLFGVEHELVKNFGVGCQRHVAALHRLQLAELSRRHRGGLHPGGRLQRHGAGDRQLQRALLPCERGRAASRPGTTLRDAFRLPPALSRLRDFRDQAAGGPVDDASRILDQRSPRVPRRAPERARIRRQSSRRRTPTRTWMAVR